MGNWLSVVSDDVGGGDFKVLSKEVKRQTN